MQASKRFAQEKEEVQDCSHARGAARAVMLDTGCYNACTQDCIYLILGDDMCL
jgi:hypothetical protein